MKRQYGNSLEFLREVYGLDFPDRRSEKLQVRRWQRRPRVGRRHGVELEVPRITACDIWLIGLSGLICKNCRFVGASISRNYSIRNFNFIDNSKLLPGPHRYEHRLFSVRAVPPTRTIRTTHRYHSLCGLHGGARWFPATGAALAVITPPLLAED